jgi:uncharacterized small protein (TIGR04563 family)
MRWGDVVRSGVGVSLYIPREMMDWLRAEAARRERSLSWVVAWWWRRVKLEASK